MIFPASAFQPQQKMTPCQGTLQLVEHTFGHFLHWAMLKDCGKDCWRRRSKNAEFPWTKILGEQIQQMFLTAGASSLEILEFSLADSLQQPSSS